MENIVSKSRVSAEDVISTLKDDGDFDKLRLKIIRKLKENEDLRNNIVSEVKQSAALNRDGAEHMTPRQLSDAIHEEIRNKVMHQISDALWGVIRSSDGMKSEISETVESVYNRLLYPKGKEVNESSSLVNPKTTMNEASNSENSPAVTVRDREDTMPDTEPREPPVLSTRNEQQPANSLGKCKEDVKPAALHDQKHVDETQLHNQQRLSPCNNDAGVPPGFASFRDSQQTYTGSDEDPDVPPGFG